MIKMDDQEFETMGELECLVSTLIEDNNIITEIEQSPLMAYWASYSLKIHVTPSIHKIWH